MSNLPGAAGVTGSSEPPNMACENQTQDLCESLLAEPALQALLQFYSGGNQSKEKVKLHALIT